MPDTEDPHPPPPKAPDLDADATVVVSDSDPAGEPRGARPRPGGEAARSAGAVTPSQAPGGLAGRLREGDQLADGRYRIVRFLGEGGMGSVYEAIDLELDVRLALKTLRAETTAPLALERFKREIHVARQVTHPNVCRLYDLGRHRTSEGQDVFFLTMQYLDGETLRERLNRDGRFTPAEAYPLARDMAAALDAAHQAGIVHRDFKSGNVMLVPSREGLRAVVTDFGLAREMVDTGRETLTVTAGFVGTPAYSSPEQIQGFEVGPASDLYAFGVVLYEMTTGRLPFDDAPTPWIAVVRRLNEMPTAPLVLQPSLPESWNAVILRCLEREPETRYAGAWEVFEALEPPPAASGSTPRPLSPVLPASGSGSRPQSGLRPPGSRPPGSGPPLSRPRGPTAAADLPAGFDTRETTAATPRGRARPRELLLIGLGGLLLLFGLLFAWLRPDLHFGNPAPAAGSGEAGEMRQAIALLGFKNLKGNPEAAWISTAVTEMLAMEVASGDTLRVIPSDRVARMKAEMRITDDEGYGAERLARVRDNLGSDLVVLGSFLSEGDVLRLDLRVENVGRGEVISRISHKGKESDLIALVEQVGDELRRDLGLSGLSPAEAQSVRAAFPESSGAARLYSEGLAHLHRFELVEATRLLEEASRAAPGNAMVLTALSDAYQTAGYEAKADATARQAFEASSGLATRYRLWIEAIHYEAARDWPRASETFETLAKLYPDDIEIGLRLAKLQIGRAGLFDQGVATLDQLEKLPLPAGNDPRVDLLKTFALLKQGQADRALAVAEGAVAESRRRGAVISEASAYAYISSAQLARGENDAALAAIERARQLFLGVGYREGASQTLTSISQVLRVRGDWAGARQRLEEAISLQRQIGVSAKLRTSLGWLAILHKSRGELRRALEIFEECLDLSAGLDEQLAFYRAAHGDLLTLVGELEAGQAELEASWIQAQKTGDRKLSNKIRHIRVHLAMQAGRLAEAEPELAALLELYRQNGQAAEVADAAMDLAHLDLLRGELGKAGERLAQVAAAGKMDEHDPAFMDRRLLEAALAIEENRLDDAEALMAAQLAVPAAQQLERFELPALLELARIEQLRAAQAGGEARLAAAGRYAERAALLLPRLETLWKRQLYEVRLERLRGLAGGAPRAKAALDRIAALRAEAAQKSYALVLLEADLASGELQRIADPAAGRERLQKVAQEAQAKGYGSLARRAAASAAP